jgi:hypothetical protein
MFEFVSQEILDRVSKDRRKAEVGGTTTPGHKKSMKKIT